MHRVRFATLAALVVALLLITPAAADPPPGPSDPVAYRLPVPGPVIDPYRPPATPYGPGNRGIDFATTPGEPVGAPADGEVTFAGAVGGGLHVVILHADGIRTSLSFLATVLVGRGQRVVAGQPVGLAAVSVHLGARRGTTYLDPSSLFTAGPTSGRAVLVPDGPDRPIGAGEEAAALSQLLAGTRTWGGRAPLAPTARSGTAAAATPPVGAAALAGPGVRAERPCAAGDRCSSGSSAVLAAASRGGLRSGAQPGGAPGLAAAPRAGGMLGARRGP